MERRLGQAKATPCDTSPSRRPHLRRRLACKSPSRWGCPCRCRQWRCRCQSCRCRCRGRGTPPGTQSRRPAPCTRCCRSGRRRRTQGGKSWGRPSAPPAGAGAAQWGWCHRHQARAGCLRPAAHLHSVGEEGFNSQSTVEQLGRVSGAGPTANCPTNARVRRHVPAATAAAAWAAVSAVHLWRPGRSRLRS